MLLDVPDAAPTLEPLRALRAVRLHALTGGRQGRWTMTVNGRWRVTFRFEEGDAHDVAVEDCHKGQAGERCHEPGENPSGPNAAGRS